MTPSGLSRARPRRRLEKVRRPQILAVAVALIREKGLWNVRIADVARRAGISPTSVVYYFGTKDELLAEAVARADDDFYGPLAEELERTDSALERLGCLVARSSESDWLLWMELWVYSRHHPETVAAQRSFHRRWIDALEAVIRYGVSTGEWRATDPRGAARRLSALTDGLAVHMVLGDPDHTRRDYVRHTLTGAAAELGCDLARLQEAADRCMRDEGTQAESMGPATAVDGSQESVAPAKAVDGSQESA